MSLKNLLVKLNININYLNNKIVLSGFSQGCMMSINVGVTLKECLNCIVGFSGKIINPVIYFKIKSKAKLKCFLIHGDHDEIVSSNFFARSKRFF